MATSPKRTERIRQLNEQAEAQRAEGKSIPWEIGVRHDRLWFPETLTHLYHLPVYSRFSPREKLVYNQAYALMILEQSVALEETITSCIRAVFKDPRVAARIGRELDEGVDHFIREEHEHTEMFWRLAQMSDRAYGEGRQYRYFKPSWIASKLTAFLCRIPSFAILWVWLALYAEERFVMSNREAKRAGDALCPLHAHLQYVHMLDEARHVQLDEYFIEECWDSAPGWKRALNRALLRLIYREAVVGSTSAWGQWKQLVRDHPEMSRYTAEVKRQLPLLKKSASYQQMASGRSTLPRTYRLWDERPEFHSFERVVPSYSAPRA